MHRPPESPGRQAPPKRQRGIAALEFSLTLTLLLLFICGVVGFGALFWMQQQLAAAAADGARAAVHAGFNGQADVPAAACLAAMGPFPRVRPCCAARRAHLAPGRGRAADRPIAPPSP